MKVGLFTLILLLVSIVYAKQPTVARTLNLKGEGSPLSMRVHDLLAKIYTEKNTVNGKITYESTSTKTAYAQLSSSKIGFAAVDFVVDANMKDLQMVPLFAAPIVIVYNFPNDTSTSPTLVLDRSTLVDIFEGRIKMWNDERIRELNPSQILPEEPISRIVRADASGSTFIFTSALSSMSEEWKQKYGASSLISWPNPSSLKYAATTQGMSKAIFQTPYSIGYITLRGAMENFHSYTFLRNRMGNAVLPTIDNIVNAMNHSSETWSNLFTKDIVDSDGDDAWPIVGYSYIAYRPNNKVLACKLYQFLYDYMQWMYTSSAASNIIKQLYFVPLQDHDRQAAINTVNYMQCRGDYFYAPYRRNLRTGGVAFGFFVLLLVIVGIGGFIVFLVKGGAMLIYNKVTGADKRQYP